MVTMTSESDKASSSVSKSKTNIIAANVAPIVEVAPNILVYKKVIFKTTLLLDLFVTFFYFY